MTNKKLKLEHPGTYIKSNVLPKGMKIIDAAKVLGVGRPALNNMLNGKAALSADMATRIEKKFGGSAKNLMDMQAAYDAEQAKDKESLRLISPYVPPFLQIKANDIETWVENNLSARARLSVFLRTLVHSTCFGLTECDFPGNDDSQRPGWDGYIVADSATSWIPEGKSGWEFGVNKKIKEKADGDYAKSVDQASAEERKEMTFVFVTPRKWSGKKEWVAKHRKKNQWKDVRAYDASDLEQWLEQSIAGQTWFANETNIPSKGVCTLEECWKEWKADCTPELSETLFAQAIENVKGGIVKKLNESVEKPLIVSADSSLEALAFLYCFFNHDNPKLGQLRDRVLVFKEPGQIAKLITKSSDFIAVTTDREVEKELAQHVADLQTILIYPKNTINTTPDISLEPLSYEPFNEALKEMDCSSDEIKRLVNETGRSLTVLRRRLSRLGAVQIPAWSKDKSTMPFLIAACFAGTWRSDNETDKVVLQLLCNDLSYEEIDKGIAQLLQYEDSPVWRGGVYCGAVSKMDILFSVRNWVTEADIRKFLEVAKLVLSEKDPSLTLPESERWAASFYGKSREISSNLRDGVCETLVLLSVYGDQLFKKNTGLNLEFEIGNIISGLLNPFTVETLETHSKDLPMYAEAAPQRFLEILEGDLNSTDPQSLALMRTIADVMFGRSYRTGLLWALEGLAWSEEYFFRVVLILAKLSKPVIEDNLVNKPEASLSSLFLYWMPQTSVPFEGRMKGLDMLCDKIPEVGWKICLQQFNNTIRTSSYNHKPRWRTDGYGFGEPLGTYEERDKTSIYALEKALNWEKHTRETLADLVRSIRYLGEEFQGRVWDLVEEWQQSASEEDKAWMREIVRVNTYTRRILVQEQKGNIKRHKLEQAKRVYDSLEPMDIVLKHQWLFLKHWVDESMDEFDEDFDYREREKGIEALRKQAIAEILEDRGIDGILTLAQKGEAAALIGVLLAEALKHADSLVSAIELVFEKNSPLVEINYKLFISGALSRLSDGDIGKALPSLLKEKTDEDIVTILVLAPFNRAVWNFVGTLDQRAQTQYWEKVNANKFGLTPEDMSYVIDKLMSVGRPRSAFHFVRFELENVNPKQIFNLMDAIGTDKDTEPTDIGRLESYTIRDVLEHLTKCPEVSSEQCASLELKFIDAFDLDNASIPNLENQIEKIPNLYVQAIVCAYKRSDEKEDPEELQAANDENRSNRAHTAHSFLERLSRVPGRGQDGTLTSDAIINWVSQVRENCKELAREAVCDLSLGKLFSHADIDTDDNIWPEKPVRDALEVLMSEHLADGLRTALYNKRGVHFRGEGGDQERELADKYRSWADALQYTHPDVAKVIYKLVDTYQREAAREDEAALVRRRIRS